MSEIERRFLDTLLFWATQKGRIKDGRLRGHGMQVGDTVSGPREDLSSAEVKKGYEFLLSLVPGRWPLPNLCSPLFQKFIDYILQNVKDLFINKKELDKFVLLKNEFQVLEGSLKYLKTFLDFIKDSGVELEKSRMLFNHVEVVTRNAAYICYLCFVEEVDDNLASGLRRKISNVFLEIKPLERRVSEIYTGALRGLVKLQVQYNRDVIEFVEGFVHFLFQDRSELSNSEACSLMLPLVNDQIKSLYHAATQLVTLLIYPPEDLCVDQGKLSDILNCAEGLIAEVASAAYSFSVEKAEEVNPVFTELLKKIDRVMEDLRDVILKALLSSECNFPRTNGLGFIGSLLRHLKELLQEGKCDSVVEHLIAEIHEELALLRSFLEKVEKKTYEYEEMKKHDLGTKVISLAYHAECKIDCLVTGDYPVWYLHLLCKILTEIKLVKDNMIEFHATIVRDVQVPIEEEEPNPVRQVVETTQLDEVVVGFDEEADLLIDRLTRGPKYLDIVSIVGMPGLGKTTLAKKVYHDEEKFMQLTTNGKVDLSRSFYENRKLCIHHSLYWAGRIGNLQARSAFFRPPKSGCQEFFDLENFKLLRVLQMECPVSDRSLQRSKELIHLKYLGIKGYLEFMPSWISNLSNLEVLLVITVGSGTTLPIAIWDMPRLKHVHVVPVASFDGRIPRKSTNICCIETLATVSLTNKLADYIIKKANRLRKLKCHCKEPLKLRLDALQLETLGVNGKILKFSLPETLTKLTLSDVLLPQSDMSNIGRLPNLVVLKLEHRAFQQGKWDVEDEEFPTLKVLKLRSLKITTWNASSESLPNLELLLVSKRLTFSFFAVI
ncbi:hypothetical protein P3S68_033922 [Capsicum galapagoense]